MSEQEKAFWVWWQTVEQNIDATTLRMAFDAGYEKAIREVNNV
jgi:glutamate synthase domain-containing protein 1